LRSEGGGQPSTFKKAGCSAGPCKRQLEFGWGEREGGPGTREETLRGGGKKDGGHPRWATRSSEGKKKIEEKGAAEEQSKEKKGFAHADVWEGDRVIPLKKLWARHQNPCSGGEKGEPLNREEMLQKRPNREQTTIGLNLLRIGKSFEKVTLRPIVNDFKARRAKKKGRDTVARGLKIRKLSQGGQIRTADLKRKPKYVKYQE